MRIFDAICLINNNVTEFNINFDIFNNNLSELSSFINSNIKAIEVSSDNTVEIKEFIGPFSDHKGENFRFLLTKCNKNIDLLQSSLMNI